MFEDVRFVAPGWDVYHLEQEWRQWVAENEFSPIETLHLIL